MTIEELVLFIEKSMQHKTVYHFTDEANFPSIRSHGILSKELLRARGLWPPPATGGNELSWQLDRNRGIDHYVSLCLTRNHKMKYVATQAGRLPNPRYLAIRPEVLQIPDVKMAFGIANANDVEILPLSQAIDKLDIEVLYTRTDWRDPAINTRLQLAEKCEILIPNLVPVQMITGYF